MSDNSTNLSMGYLFKTFLKVGSFSFGGFMALIAVLQNQMVEEDKTLDNQVLLDGVSLASILPGPLAVNTVGFVGYRLKGFWGGLLSMFAVTLPCFLLVLLFSVFYFQYGELQLFQTIISWVMPAIVVIILMVVVNMSKKHLTGASHIVLAAVALVAGQWLNGIFATLVVMLVGAVFGFFFLKKKEENALTTNITASTNHLIRHFAVLLAVIVVIVLGLYFFQNESLWLTNLKVLFTFSSMSLTLFGGGYVIIPIIQETIVESMQWLSLSEFNTALAISQITPGPILISATFIGYKVAGFTGACLATLGIFLPSGLLMIVCSHWLIRYKDNKNIKGIFEGLRPVVIGLILSAAIRIARGTLTDEQTLISFGLLLIAGLWFKLSTPMLMLSAMGIGLIGFLL
ncbi:MAG: chromate efflux transporter [Reichenbachiella sp.]|uniref:chromate efflux transporter n=1 Tax=Reichenbachiella sp. TaxID=2184521 RepID=UPI0032993CF3